MVIVTPWLSVRARLLPRLMVDEALVVSAWPTVSDDPRLNDSPDVSVRLLPVAFCQVWFWFCPSVRLRPCCQPAFAKDQARIFVVRAVLSPGIQLAHALAIDRKTGVRPREVRRLLCIVGGICKVPVFIAIGPVEMQAIYSAAGEYLASDLRSTGRHL